MKSLDKLLSVADSNKMIESKIALELAKEFDALHLGESDERIVYVLLQIYARLRMITDA